jgi:hypothetical protein
MRRGAATLAAACILTLHADAALAGPVDAEAHAAADFFVAPDGDDSFSGTLAAPNADATDGPFATLARARDAVRTLIARHKRDATVLIRGGTYRLSQTVVFSLDNSAGPDATITYAAYPGEKPVFSSGQPISGWRKPGDPPEGLSAAARGNVWVADVAGRGRFFTLFDGDRRLPRARGPGFSQTNSTPRGSQDYETVQFPAGAVGGLANLSDAELRIVPSHFWIMNLLPIESIDEAASTLKTAVPGTYPLGRNGMTDRHNAWVENALEVLDEPGEWVLDTSKGRLYLWPRGDEPGDDVVAPALTELIRVEGRIDYEGSEDTPIEGLVFEGLGFTHGDRYPWHGRTGWGLQHDWECFDKPTALVRFRGAQRCAVEACELFNSGHTAIRLDLHCQRIRLAGNHVHHVGGAGVLLAGYGPGTKDVNRSNEVVDNYVHHAGREYWGSAGIFAWQSGENRIAHNHVHHLPYTAVLATGRIVRTPPGPAECSRTIRWHEVPRRFPRASWGEREPYLHARKNVIEYNEIHNVMQKLGDGNAIYVSGAGGGNVVRYNYCHDCTGPYMNAVIRCDDDQHGTLMEGNVCCRTGGHGEGFISKGDNDLVNNVVADLRPVARHRGYVVFPYGSIHGSRIERNVLYSRGKGQILYHHGRPSGRHGEPPRLRDTQTDYNLYFSTEDESWAQEHLKSQRAVGNERHSVEADPEFVDVDAGDFRFRPGSPAAKLGIDPLDVSKAGLRPPYRERFVGRRLHTRITPGDGTLRRATRVTITCDAPEAEIRYTLDGSEPTRASAAYEAPLVLEHPTVVRAKAFADGATDLVGAVARYRPPPAPIAEDFESVPVGGVTPGAHTDEDPKLEQYTARVSGEQPAGGRRSLRFADGPGQARPFTPHVYYRRTYADQRMVGRFDLRVDRTSSVYYQWRQYDDGYASGPTVTVQPGGAVVHAGKRLLTVPLDQWVRFEVACPLGDYATGAFDLRVRLPGEQTPHVFQDLACSADFTRLDWIGFVAKSDNEAVFFVDNVEIRPGEE